MLHLRHLFRKNLADLSNTLFGFLFVGANLVEVVFLENPKKKKKLRARVRPEKNESFFLYFNSFVYLIGLEGGKKEKG